MEAAAKWWDLSNFAVDCPADSLLACTFQCLLYSLSPCKCMKVEICGSVILSVVLYGCETWSVILREEHSLRVF